MMIVKLQSVEEDPMETKQVDAVITRFKRKGLWERLSQTLRRRRRLKLGQTLPQALRDDQYKDSIPTTLTTSKP
jgi:transposase